ncbi:MAG: hypothetical protein AB9879_14755 [Methanothrix sp.]|jgi:hypothetical protein|nr:hypothetical protein [Methanothrix sp.]
MNDDELIYKKSKLRTEIEDLLKEKGITLERRISLMNLDSGEVTYFDDYADALAFMKGKKGRWYLTTPGLRRTKEK